MTFRACWNAPGRGVHLVAMARLDGRQLGAVVGSFLQSSRASSVRLRMTICFSLRLLRKGGLGAGQLGFERDERLEHAVLVAALSTGVDAVEAQSLRRDALRIGHVMSPALSWSGSTKPFLTARASEALYQASRLRNASSSAGTGWGDMKPLGPDGLVARP